MFSNPILRGLHPDPSICRAGDDYYLATSTMALFPGVPIHHSRDLVNWRLIGHALTRPSQFCPDNSGRAPMIYAPTLRFHDGTFYLITTNVNGRGNFYVTAQNPGGPWSEPIFVDAEVFDPSLFFDLDGKVYYTRRNHLHHKDVVQAEIDLASGKLLTPLRSIGAGMVSDDAEGPHLYRIGDWYYLILAEGGSRFLHMATVGRAKTPYGPFEPCPHNPIISQHHAWWHPLKSLGHGDLIEAHDGSWWIVFLGTRHCSYDALTLLGRETFLAPVEWQDGWPIVHPPALRSLTVDAPTLPLHLWPQKASRDDFDDEELALQWTFTGVPDDNEKWWNLSERPGFLRLQGGAQSLNSDDKLPVAFVGQRQSEFDCEARTECEFEAQNEREEAGTSVFQASNYHYDLFLSRRQGQRAIVLRKCVGDIAHEAAVTLAPPGAIRFRVCADANLYSFFYAPTDGEWISVGSALTQLLGAEIIGNWSGVLIGIYSSGNGKKCERPADFGWFEMQHEAPPS